MFDINIDTDITDSACSLNYDPIYEALSKGRLVILRETGDSLGWSAYELVSAWLLDPNIGLVLFTIQGYTNGLLFPIGSYHTTS